MKDSIYLLWTNSITKQKYKVAELYKQNEMFYFKYLDNIDEAINNGFKPLIAFPDIKRTYDNPKLFAVFASRLPEPNRPEIDKILNSYNMKKYDAFELLKKGGGKYIPIIMNLAKYNLHKKQQCI